MAGTLNRATIIGSLGKDPEVKSFQNGGRICNFSVATSESWKDKATGEKKERTEWHNITIRSDGLINIAERYLRKGSKVMIEGQIQTRKWQDKNGVDRYSTEIVLSGFDSKLLLLSPAAGGGGGGNRSGGGDSGSGGGGQQRQREGRFGNDYGSNNGGFAGEGGTAGGSDWGRTGGGSSFADDDLDDSIPF